MAVASLFVATALALAFGPCASAEPSAVGGRATDPNCSAAANAAERAWSLPEGLLAAIGRAESGRPDPATGRLEPSPWAINAVGEGRFFASAEAAIAYVQALQMHGIGSVDVGCFQVNLMHHPAAFGSLREAFDPAANAAAAARFLAELHAKSGDWDAATAMYHSAVPAFGEPYRARVFAQWRGGAARSPPLSAAAWPPQLRGDPFVVALAPGAAAIPVFTPGGGVHSEATAPNQQRPLPRVFTPAHF